MEENGQNTEDKTRGKRMNIETLGQKNNIHYTHPRTHAHTQP